MGQVAKPKEQRDRKPTRGMIVASALDMREMPPDQGPPEVAFMGRSNAGKSSLINRLVGAKVAHTSGTPGRTQRINFFHMPGWYIVDLPGFGYAKVSKESREIFGQAVEGYLTGRQALVAAVLIQDARRNPEEEEAMVVHWAADRNILLVVAASKMDRLNRREQAERHQVLEEAYGRPVFLVSSRTGEGMDQVKGALKGIGLNL